MLQMQQTVSDVVTGTTGGTGSQGQRGNVGSPGQNGAIGQTGATGPQGFTGGTGFTGKFVSHIRSQSSFSCTILLICCTPQSVVNNHSSQLTNLHAHSIL